MLQIVGVGQGYLADRYTYIPYFGLFFLMAYGFDYFLASKRGQYRNLTYLIAAVMLVGYAIFTWQQNKVWKNSDTLWSKVIEHYPRCVTAIQNRGEHFEKEGEFQKSAEDYQMALTLAPDNPSLYKNYGKLLFHLGNNPLALTTLNKGINLGTEDPELYLNRGAVYATLKQFPQAFADFDKVIELDPNEAEGYLNRSNVYFEMQQAEPCLKDITTYLTFKPNYADGWFRKGLMNSLLKKDQEAIQNLTKAIELDRNNGNYFYQRARLYNLIGDIARSNEDLQRAKQLGVGN